MQKFNFNGESFLKIEWKQTDGRMEAQIDRDKWISFASCRINAVGNNSNQQLVELQQVVSYYK